FQHKILSICDKHGTLQQTPQSIQKAFEEFYIDFLGSAMTDRTPIQQHVVQLGNLGTEQKAGDLMKPFSDEDIKAAIFSISSSKAPCSDGFNSTFFQSAWHIVGPDICNAVNDFFTNCKMLKELNCTNLTLIPKVLYPKHMSEFRPITCCRHLHLSLLGAVND
ncbi:LINE-1 reverse transcriptase-like protein, partial [Bienertia sinuspersici]